MRALLVQVAAAQNIMVVASKDVFCLSVQRTMALIFVESAMSSLVKMLMYGREAQDMDSQPCRYSEVRGTQ